MKYYIGHSDRITSDLSEKGYKLLVQSQETMLRKFKDDIEKMPKIHSNILNDLASCHISLGNIKESKILLKKAIRLDPKSISGWYKYFIVCIGGKRLYIGSRELYQWLLSKIPNKRSKL